MLPPPPSPPAAAAAGVSAPGVLGQVRLIREARRIRLLVRVGGDGYGGPLRWTLQVAARTPGGESRVAQSGVVPAGPRPPGSPPADAVVLDAAAVGAATLTVSDAAGRVLARTVCGFQPPSPADGRAESAPPDCPAL